MGGSCYGAEEKGMVYTVSRRGATIHATDYTMLHRQYNYLWGEPRLVRLQTYWTVVDTMRQNRAPITAPHLILGHANIHLC